MDSKGESSQPASSATPKVAPNKGSRKQKLKLLEQEIAKSKVIPKTPSDSSSYLLSRWYFLKMMALVYLCAFGSWYPQIMGLYGPTGLLPVGSHLHGNVQSTKWDSFFKMPTILWWSEDFGFTPAAGLQTICLIGVVVSVLAMLGMVHSVAFATLWFLYLSVYHAGQTFSSFQWDILLLEAGFLTIFYAPMISVKKYAMQEPPSSMIRWLIRWLLFRLMFSSGIVKLLSNSDAWWKLTALTYHYETTCLPNALSWYIHQLPIDLQKVSVIIMFVIEILLPWLVFTPSQILRHFNAFAQMLLQVMIILTGNYSFFNMLTIALCFALVDDSIWKIFLSSETQKWFFGKKESTSRTRWILEISQSVPVLVLVTWIVLDVGYFQLVLTWNWNGLVKFMDVATPLSLCLGTLLTIYYTFQHFKSLFSSTTSLDSNIWTTFGIFKGVFLIPVVGLVFISSLYPYTSRIHRSSTTNLPPIVQQVYANPYTQPYQLTSSYGLFASLTTYRDEIILEGSMDGQTWKGYEFKYKPGNVNRLPPFVAPHQPRLDWQMWFAPLGTYQRNGWFVMLVGRLLQGSKQVAGLLEHNPFPDDPPKMIRSGLWNYHFTNWETGRNGSWWTRTPKGEYMPTITLSDDLKTYMSKFESPKLSKDLVKSVYISRLPLWVYGAVCVAVVIAYVINRVSQRADVKPKKTEPQFITRQGEEDKKNK